MRFESSVNPEGIQTLKNDIEDDARFESSVNPEGIQTALPALRTREGFESSVNPEGIQTFRFRFYRKRGLRAV